MLRFCLTNVSIQETILRSSDALYSPMPSEVQTSGCAPARVWVIAPSPPPLGGMSVQAERLQKKLNEEGIPATLIPTNPKLPEFLKHLESVPVVRTGLRELSYLTSLKPLVREHGVIHHFSASHLFFFLHSAPVLLLGRILGNKVVLNYRGGQANEFLQRWSWLVIPLLKRADEVVVPSAYLQRLFAVHGIHARILPNIADADGFPFKERNHFRPRLFVSRSLEPMYDIESVVRAFQIIQKERPDATLGIAGSGSQETSLRRLVLELQLRDVTFFGAVQQKDLGVLYDHFDIYVNASRVDNFPGSLVEAACAGLPIVTTAPGGIRDMIRHGETGLLVDTGDYEVLASGVLYLLERQHLAERLARTARCWAEQFSWSNVFPKLLECYGLEATAQSRVDNQSLAVI